MITTSMTRSPEFTPSRESTTAQQSQSAPSGMWHYMQYNQNTIL